MISATVSANPLTPVAAELPLFGPDARVQLIDATTIDINPEWEGVASWIQAETSKAIRNAVTERHGIMRGLPYA